MAVTGKDHARVNLGIWGDDDWLDLSPSAQHLYLVLWTSPGLSYCGAGEWRPGKIAQRAAGWTTADVEQAAAELSRELFLLIDAETEEFLLRSWMKHDRLWKQPHMAVSMANARSDMASRGLRGVVVHEVQKIRRDNPGLGAWTKEPVLELLAQKAVDPQSLPTFHPSSHPPVDPSCVETKHVDTDPISEPPSTPSPSPNSVSKQQRSTNAASTESIEQVITTEAYEELGKAFNFIAVRQIVKWAIHTRTTDPASVKAAVLAIHRAGRPITKQTVDQWLTRNDRSGQRDPKSGLLVER